MRLRHFSMLAVLVATCTVIASSAGAVTVLNTFPAEWISGLVDENGIEGLAYGSGSLWYSRSDMIYEKNPATGANINSYAATGFINDLTWVSGELWGARVSPREIVRLNPATGAELGTIDTAAQGVPEGLAFDGTTVYLSVDGTPGTVFPVNPTTGAVGTGRPGKPSDAEALAFGSGYLWEGGKNGGAIYKVDATTGVTIAVGTGPSTDIHGMTWDGTHLWITSQDSKSIYELDVTDVNAPPTLTYPSIAGFSVDGVDPNSGNSSTVFDFKCVYTDIENDPPVTVMLAIWNSGAPIAGSPFTLTNTTDLNYTDGAEFGKSMTLPLGMNHTYQFSAVNAIHVADGNATQVANGPEVSNAPPTLDYTGEPGYTADGVDPEVGDAWSTPFTYRALYTGVLEPVNILLHVLNDGKAIWGSPFTLTTGDTTPADGAIYTVTRQLKRSRKYTYRFEADDGIQSAGGPATGLHNGPSVGNFAPVLDWTGEPLLVDEGVRPLNGTERTNFMFRVKYSDRDRDLPAFIRLHVTNVVQGKNDVPVPGSPFAMARATKGGDVKRGLVYKTRLKLKRGRGYKYWFEAADPFAAATGVPTVPRPGPFVNSPPFIEWASYAGWIADGVDPDTGVGDTLCSFRCVYHDADNDDATFVKVEIEQVIDGERVPFAGSPVTLGLWAAAQPRDGQEYFNIFALPPGDYRHRFLGSDGVAKARGVPTKWKRGPMITSTAGASMVSALTAAPTPMGAQVTFSLSAAGQVDARVVNIAGRPIQSIALGKDCEAGLNTLIWNGTDASGLSVPSGVYIIAVTTRDASGGVSQAAVPLTLRR